MIKNQPQVLREEAVVGRATAILVVIGIMLSAGATLGQAVAPPPGGPTAAPPSGAAMAPGVVAVAPPPTSTEPVLVPGIAEFQISPRSWFLFESFGQTPRNPGSLNGSSSNGSDDFLLGGASVSARFNSLPQTSFVLTGLYGTNAPSRAINNSFDFSTSTIGGSNLFTNSSSESSLNTSRIDIEFLGVTTMPDSNWSWIAGGRFEHHATTATGTAVVNEILSPCITNCTSTFFGPTRFSGPISIYTVKGGLAGQVPLTADNSLSLFGNIMALAGFAVPPAGTPDYGVIGPDTSIGLQYRFSPTITADLRYRAMVYFNFSRPPGYPNYIVYQGPMIGVNFQF